MDENVMSKVYVKANDYNLIIRCEGGYTIGNITDFTGWTLIDEGNGDKYNLCQSHYFPGGLYTEDGIPRYKLEGGQAVERTEEEIEADRASLPEPEPTAEDVTLDMLADHEERLCMLEITTTAI